MSSPGQSHSIGVFRADMIASMETIQDTDYMLANHPVPAMFVGLAPFIQLAGMFKSHLKTPTIHAARISDLATARYAVEEGIMDLVGMTRAHIADPHIINKLKEGREQEIRPCVGAGYCIDRIYNEGEMLCIHNVATTREEHIDHITSPTIGEIKKVVIIFCNCLITEKKGASFFLCA